jgi:C4-type Zn-finger protein
VSCKDMTMTDFYYQLECPMCEQTMELVVQDEDERPLFCALCGAEAPWKTDIDEE